MLIFNLTHSLINLSFKLILIPITHNGFIYLKKIGNYQKTFYVITKNDAENENRDNIITLIS